MTVKNILKISTLALVVSAFVFGTTSITSDALAAGKGKPSFAGKPEEKMGKGGRSEQAKEHAKSKGKKMKDKMKKKDKMK